MIALTTFLTVLALQAEPPICLSYEPAPVQISGRLVRLTFPGRPNYESIEEGDEPETGFYLELSSGVCTIGDPASELNTESLGDVPRVQLVLGQAELPEEYAPYLGRELTCSGTLFRAHTAHHHTPVLMTVDHCGPRPDD